MPSEETHSPIEKSSSQPEINDILSEKILDFLSSPWLYASPERLKEVTADNSLDFYRSTPDSWRYFTENAYSVWGLTAIWHPFSKDDNSRIMLLSSNEIQQLVMLLGLLAVSSRLKTVINGEEIRKLKQDFPGLYPECLRLNCCNDAVLKKLCSQADQITELTQAAITALGRKLLAGMMHHLPGELRKRWELKFEKAALPETGSAPLSVRESNALLLSLLHHLHPESWQLCCC